jgi:hypothetical protein
MNRRKYTKRHLQFFAFLDKKKILLKAKTNINRKFINHKTIPTFAGQKAFGKTNE